jgi:hypothetical protein
MSQSPPSTNPQCESRDPQCTRESILACRGCSCNFCRPHYNDHRQTLENELEHITSDIDAFEQRIHHGSKG